MTTSTIDISSLNIPSTQLEAVKAVSLEDNNTRIVFRCPHRGWHTTPIYLFMRNYPNMQEMDYITIQHGQVVNAHIV